VLRTLLIMRHGKSRWSEEYGGDLDRPLAKRGKQDSLRMGEEIRARDLMPDVILSSPAKRASSTTRRVIEGSGFEGEAFYDVSLYYDGVEAYLSDLSILPGDVRVAMIVGHNPTLEQLVQLLTGEFVRLPTAALACVDLPIESWASLALGAEGNLREIILPHELEQDARWS